MVEKDHSSRSRSDRHDGGAPFIVSDPCTVFRDALHYTSWTDQGGSLPQRGDWSTYRLASKDLILGIATHRFNTTTRRLDVRAYFCGEHPIFEELEPTRAMMAILLCQSYQTGNSLAINFEYGIPFDVRALIERHTGQVISGHETLLSEAVTRPLFISICGISNELQSRIQDQRLNIASVCYNIFRGTWSALQVNALLERGVPLVWVFRRSPNPIENPAPYFHLVHNLRAVLLEEYAIKRLEDRQFGETTNKPITAWREDVCTGYVSELSLEASGDDISIQIPARQPFLIFPLLPSSPDAFLDAIHRGLSRISKMRAGWKPLFVLPMDFVYAARERYDACILSMQAAQVDWLIVGQTMAQLLSEIEQKLAISAGQIDSDEVDASNVDKHTD